MKYDALRAHWREVVSGFLKIGALSYGGPAIMGLMQTEPCRQALIEKGVVLLRNGWWVTQKTLTHPTYKLK
jgi:chromate transport protein ChrA